MNEHRTLRESLELVSQCHQDDLYQLAVKHGWEAKGFWRIKMTEFHGGREISRHASADNAIKRACREKVESCICGCTEIYLEKI